MVSTNSWFDARTARVVWTVLVFLGVLGLVYALRRVLLLIALSLFFAFLLFPLVRFTQQRLIRSRLLAIVLVYLVVFAAVGGAGVAVVPRLATEVQNLAQQLPETTKRIQSGELVTTMLARKGWEWDQIREVERLVQSHMGEIIGYAQEVAAATLKWLTGAWVILLIPIFAFFILKDAERLGSVAISQIAAARERGMWWGLVDDLTVLLGQYVRALLLLALFTFVAWSAVFLTAGVPYALVLAGIGAALEFIPVVGPFTAAVVAVGVCLFTGYAHPWLILAFVLVWRGIQDYALSPLVMSRGVEIHPALVILGVLAGGELAGVAGMFLSVPLIAAIRIVWRRLRAERTLDTEIDYRDRVA